MFVHTPEDRGTPEDGAGIGLQVSVIDIQNIDNASWKLDVMVQVREAAKNVESQSKIYQ